jgi:hypothetical protein
MCLLRTHDTVPETQPPKNQSGDPVEVSKTFQFS